jgi:microcin C transport system permease protein
MLSYIVRRLLLIIPTLLGIMMINFFIVQAAPGGPIEQVIAELTGTGASTERITRSGGDFAGGQGKQTQADAGAGEGSAYRGARGLDPDFIKDLEVRFGFDKPMHERFLDMLWNFACFDFGESFFRSERVVDLVLSKLPVSISLGLWTTLLVYMISIPLGIAKATRDGEAFDLWTSAIVILGYAIPGFLFAVLLLVVFAGGSYWQWFPSRGLTSENFEQMSWLGQLADYFWHLALPVISMVIGGFAGLTMLTKNSFMDQINQQYVLTARAKGLTERCVLYGHVFRNAMLIVIAGFPAAFIGILFTGALLVEIIFSLDGLGLLGYEAAIKRDYPIMFASVWFFSVLGLLMGLIGDLTYMLIDPRIDFEARRS